MNQNHLNVNEFHCYPPSFSEVNPERAKSTFVWCWECLWGRRSTERPAWKL